MTRSRARWATVVCVRVYDWNIDFSSLSCILIRAHISVWIEISRLLVCWYWTALKLPLNSTIYRLQHGLWKLCVCMCVRVCFVKLLFWRANHKDYFHWNIVVVSVLERVVLSSGQVDTNLLNSTKSVITGDTISSRNKISAFSPCLKLILVIMNPLAMNGRFVSKQQEYVEDLEMCIQIKK